MLPDWSMLLAAITTIFLAAEKQWMMLDWKPRRSDMLVDPFGIGRIVQDGLVFRQNFSIRSYEIGITSLYKKAGFGLFAITPAGERGMCCKAIKLGNARVFPVTTL